MTNKSRKKKMIHKSRKKKKGIPGMIIGAALILSALALFGWNSRENAQAGKQAEVMLSQIHELMESGESEQTEKNEHENDAYYGILSIPALELELPVMKQWDYPSLRSAPCRYYGLAETDDLVIAAHNYKAHFGNISDLVPGDIVIFTDMDGSENTYAVVEAETLNATDVEEMTAGEYALTLFTCTYGGKMRAAVRCQRAEQ